MAYDNECLSDSVRGALDSKRSRCRGFKAMTQRQGEFQLKLLGVARGENFRRREIRPCQVGARTRIKDSERSLQGLHVRENFFVYFVVAR